MFANIVKFADEAIKSIKSLRKRLGVSGDRLETLGQMVLNTKEALGTKATFVNSKLNYTKNGIDEESLTTTIENIHESSKTSALELNALGIIKAGEQEIKLNLKFNLSKSFTQKSFEISQKQLGIRLIDPLVINLDGALPELEDDTFSFDIDSDDKKDQISKLKKGNGFLALDKNNNGKIDDGSELFGTQNGDGFADLSRFDDDKNGWIDENDSILMGFAFG